MNRRRFLKTLGMIGASLLVPLPGLRQQVIKGEFGSYNGVNFITTEGNAVKDVLTIEDIRRAKRTLERYHVQPSYYAIVNSDTLVELKGGFNSVRIVRL